MQRPPTEPRNLVPEVPPWLDALLVRALRVAPEARFPSIDALLASRLHEYDGFSTTAPVRFEAESALDPEGPLAEGGLRLFEVAARSQLLLGLFVEFLGLGLCQQLELA